MRPLPSHTFTPAQLMKVLQDSFYDREAIYIIAERCHPARPVYLLHSECSGAPNQIRWEKRDGVWYTSTVFGLPYWTEKALIQTALEKGVPAD